MTYGEAVFEAKDLPRVRITGQWISVVRTVRYVVAVSATRQQRARQPRFQPYRYMIEYLVLIPFLRIEPLEYVPTGAAECRSFRLDGVVVVSVFPIA